MPVRASVSAQELFLPPMPCLKAARSLLASTLCATAICVVPSVAAAAPPATPIQKPTPRRGLYLHAAMGADAMGGKVSYSALLAVGGPARVYSYQADFGGAGADVDLAVGWAPVDGLAFALEGRDLLQMSGSAKFTHTTLSNLSLQTLGGLVDYYPFPLGRVHVQLGLGFAHNDYVNEEQANLAPQTIVVHSDDMTGVLGHTGVGYEWRAHTGFQVGPMLDVWVTRLASKEGRTTARGISLLISAGWM